ncbi:hypothetical protein [Variovorax sp. GT1P44]|uniref:hypothetical protein n=1 Tax=Variovorax sp. GT1P44 TaxID=3443742 RepID=UPI003F472DD5
MEAKVAGRASGERLLVRGIPYMPMADQAPGTDLEVRVGLHRARHPGDSLHEKLATPTWSPSMSRDTTIAPGPTGSGSID